MRTPVAGKPPKSDGAEPPPGPPWDLPLAEAPLAFLDLEMTGLDPAVDRVLEVCVERVRGGRVEDRLETLVHPDERRGNVHIHGIDEEALAGAPPFDRVAERVIALCDGAIVVAHAAAWDVAFLEAELARSGRDVKLPFFLDTLTLSRRAFALPSHALDALAKELAIPRTRAHRAGDDVHVLRAVFERLVRELEPSTPRELWHVRVGERKARPEIVAACVHAAEAKTPVVVTFRPARKPARAMEACITSVRTDLDPPRVMGYALPGRGRFDLRADRILSVAAPAAREPDPKSP